MSSFGAASRCLSLLLCFSLGFCLCSCSKQNAPRLPPPVYEKPTLPNWQAPPPDPDASFDLEGMEGEPVADDEVEPKEENLDPDEPAELPVDGSEPE